MLIQPASSTSIAKPVTASSVLFGVSMTETQTWMLVSSTNAWWRQGATPTAVAGANANVFIPAGVPMYISGRLGVDVAIIRDTADGKATLTQIHPF